MYLDPTTVLQRDMPAGLFPNFHVPPPPNQNFICHTVANSFSNRPSLSTKLTRPAGPPQQSWGPFPRPPRPNAGTEAVPQGVWPAPRPAERPNRVAQESPQLSQTLFEQASAEVSCETPPEVVQAFGTSARQAVLKSEPIRERVPPSLAPIPEEIRSCHERDSSRNSNDLSLLREPASRKVAQGSEVAALASGIVAGRTGWRPEGRPSHAPIPTPVPHPTGPREAPVAFLPPPPAPLVPNSSTYPHSPAPMTLPTFSELQAASKAVFAEGKGGLFCTHSLAEFPPEGDEHGQKREVLIQKSRPPFELENPQINRNFESFFDTSYEPTFAQNINRNFQQNDPTLSFLHKRLIYPTAELKKDQPRIKKRAMRRPQLSRRIKRKLRKISKNLRISWEKGLSPKFTSIFKKYSYRKATESKVKKGLEETKNFFGKRIRKFTQRLENVGSTFF